MVNTTEYRNRYLGNGATTVFDYSFPVSNKAYILVTLTDIETGVDTVLAEGTDYTVAGVGNVDNTTWKITMLSAPATGTRLTLTPNYSITQEVDFENGEKPDAEVQEFVADKTTMILKQFREELDRTVQVPRGDTSDPAELVAGLKEDAASAADSADSAAASALSAAASALSAAASALSAITVMSRGGNSGSLGYRNRLLNPDFLRYTRQGMPNASTIAAGQNVKYTADRCHAYCAGADMTFARLTGAGVANGIQFTGASGVTSFCFGQRIMASNMSGLAGKNVVAQAILSSSSLTSVNWRITKPSSSSDTWGTVASPAWTVVASGTWSITSTPTLYNTNAVAAVLGATDNLGLCLEIYGGAFTSGTLTCNFYQLEEGSTAGALEYPIYESLIAACMRYSMPIGQNPSGIIGVGIASANNQVDIPIFLPMGTRTTTPSAVTGSLSGVKFVKSGGSTVTPNAVSLAGTTNAGYANTLLLRFGFASGVSLGDIGLLTQDSGSYIAALIDSEMYS